MQAKSTELIDNYKKREAEINADTFSQNESASQSEDRELENMNHRSLVSKPASPRRPPPKHHAGNRGYRPITNFHGNNGDTRKHGDKSPAIPHSPTANSGSLSLPNLPNETNE
jgi:hypothetical protein